MVFDTHGNLVPYEIHKISITEFEKTFGYNNTRITYLEHLFAVIGDIKKLVAIEFIIWIDGSFVTKKEGPKDIDVVIFLNYEYISLFQDELRRIKSKLKSVDLYFVKVFSEDHKDSQLTNLDKLYWLHFFGTDRRNRKKGFIELKV